jgi:predicted transcriptional regulator
MESLCDLLFELSNEDRLKILLELKGGPMNLSRIAKKLDFTAQGTSRNVARLTQVSMIVRDPNGGYALTSFGENALNLLAPYEFLSQEKDYIISHSTRWLPPSFVSRLGELRKNERVTELLDVIGNIARERREAAEYEWYIAPGRMSSPRDADDVIEALERGVKIRAIEPSGYVPSSKVMSEVPREKLDIFEENWRRGNLQVRHLADVKIRMYLTERAVAILAFPKEDGEVDVLGYQSTDPEFHMWCRDLFDHFWGEAEQVSWFWTQGRAR